MPPVDAVPSLPHGRRLQVAALLAGVALFAYLLHETGIVVLASNLGTIGWGTVVVIVLELVVDAVNTVAWRCTFRPEDRRVGLFTLFLVRLAGTAFNQLVPSASVAGEPVKVVLLRRRVESAAAWASVITAKLSYALAQAIFVLLGLVLACARLDVPRPLAWALAAAFALTTAALLAFLGVQRRGLFATVVGAGARLGLPRRWVAAIGGATASLDASIRDLHARRPLDFVRSVAWHLSGFGFGVLQMFLLLRWLGLSGDFVACVAIESFSILISLALFLVPGSIGVQEGGKVVVFTALGLPASAGLAVGVVFRIVQAAEIALGLATFAALTSGAEEPAATAATLRLRRASKCRSHVASITDSDSGSRASRRGGAAAPLA
jgi:uncharacterized protein (TIRG00374 family)